MPIYKYNASRYTYYMCYTTYYMYNAPRYTYYKYNASRTQVPRAEVMRELSLNAKAALGHCG